MPVDQNFAFLLLGILLAATVVAGTLSSRFGVPALIGFLGLGMIAGSDGLGGIAFAEYGLAQTIGAGALLFILFSGGLDTSWAAVRKVASPALVLATVGVAISAGVMALASVLLLGFDLVSGLLLGAIIGSTDAAAVFAVMRTQGLGLKADIQSLIEFESGSNDPMAIFLVGAMLVFIAAPATPLLSLGSSFVLQMTVGAAVGAAVGYGFAGYMRRSRLRTGGLALVVSVAAGFLAFGLAGVLQGNGFLAAYLAGIVAGNQSFPMSRAVKLFQDGVAWLGQVVMFLILGLLVFPSQLPQVAGLGLAITAILMLLARPISVFACLLPFRRFSLKELVFVSWAGLRGAVPIVLATFPVVAGAPNAETIFNITFFVVLASSLVQGPTLGWAARRLGIAGPAGGPAAASDAVAVKTTGRDVG
ncbi:MAG: potassium/proton antiporter [Phenylobacterium sp.]|uniref:potassium/proton antiporter n=1 Tax=Phenylobacterium sp. TaxID=1871053 RepID=UPI00391C04EE